tara:strand:- start:129 stop:422 length:294 start_codon:yes stop_codon:yes gene_type:complete
MIKPVLQDSFSHAATGMIAPSTPAIQRPVVFKSIRVLSAMISTNARSTIPAKKVRASEKAHWNVTMEIHVHVISVCLQVAVTINQKKQHVVMVTPAP